MDDLTQTGLTQTELIAVVVGVVLVVALIAALVVRARAARRRRERLSERFGPEYDRTVDAASKRGDAERELQARLDRHADITTRPIEPGDAQAFEQRLDDLQARFVDAPAAAVVAADGVLADIAVAAGYPDGPTEQLLGDISVDHPVAVADHRRGQQVAQRTGKKSPSTEELRTALVAARHLCEALLAPSSATRSAADRHDEVDSGSGRRDEVGAGDGRRDDARSGADRRDEVDGGNGRRDESPGETDRADASASHGSQDSHDQPTPDRAPPGAAPQPRAAGAQPPPPPTPATSASASDEDVIELPEHEQVGRTDGRSRAEGQPGEGLLGPDGRPVH